MTVFFPGDLDEALQLRALHPTATPIAGGTDVCVQWPERVARPGEDWLDLSGVPELRGLRWQGLKVLDVATTAPSGACPRRLAFETPARSLDEPTYQVGS